MIVLLISCQKNNGITKVGFEELMANVAQGWSTQNTQLALESFAEDAVYMQPPNVQFYQGHDQLRKYFDALDEAHQMTFHDLWFNEETQTGAGEFTFSYGSDTADTGVIVVRLENGKIKHWREYFTKGPANFDQFIKTENKDWRWHIGNYP
ncbi:MAG: nuclear transport factor 2 family protein [Bacteroidota bacterium]